MKKYAYILAAAAMVVVACAKENTLPEENNNTPAKEKVTLTATLPAFETKAAVDAQGVFSWTANDQIDVKYSDNNTYTFTCSDPSKGEFTYDGTITAGATPTVAYYPKGYAGTASDQTFASIDDAAKGFQMTATYTDGQLTFVHKSALIHLTFTNVPAFATAIKIYTGESSAPITTVAIAPASDGETVDVVLPISSDNIGSEHKFYFVLQENDNVIQQAYKKATLAFGTYYSTPEITVGRIISLINNSGWAKSTNTGTIESPLPALYIWNANGTETKWFCTNQESRDSKLLVRTNGSGEEVLYVVLDPNQISWVADGSAVGVKFQTDPYSDSKTTQTSYYLISEGRAMEFKIPAGGGMKTDYRIFIQGNPGEYNKAYAYISGGDENVWGKWPGMAFASGGYLPLSEDRYGQKFEVIFSKDGSAQLSDEEYMANRDYVRIFSEI